MRFSIASWRHGVCTLVDDDTTVAEFPFECGVETHGFAPLGGNPSRYGWGGQGPDQKLAGKILSAPS